MIAPRRPPKAYRVTLVFQSGPKFSCVEQAHDIPTAIAQAMRYARACGWDGELRKKFVNEIDQEMAA